MRARHRRSIVTLAALGVLFGGWLLAPPVASAPAYAVAGTFNDSGFTFSYSLSGVEPDADDKPFQHSGRVVADQVTLSGSATYTIEDGYVTNLGMRASLSVAGESAEDHWPPEGVDGRVGGTTVTFPFSLTVKIPPPEPAEDTVPPFAETTGTTELEPYTTLSFAVSARSCNDWGVCAGPAASGSFEVFATASTSSPTVDWIAAVGALGGAAAAAAAVGLLGGRPAGDGTRDDGEQSWRYVLQVAADHVAVDATAGGSIDVEVWAVDNRGTAVPAGDAAVSVTAAGPFAVTPASGQGGLHASVAATAPPGATGSASIVAVAGPMQMTTTVALECIGTYALELVPVGDPVLRPDSATGGYLPALVDVFVTSRGPEGPVPAEAAVTGAETTPEGLVAVTQEPAPGPAPGVRLHVELAADPVELTDPANQSVELLVTAEPAGVADAEPLTGTVTVRLQPPTGVIHWVQTGHPETLDAVIEVPAEADATLDLEVWLEATDGNPPPEAEFSHMANVDLADNQLVLTKADFACHPDSRPWQQPAADDRAHSRWRVVHALPSTDRPDLVPPVDTAIRVRAWKAGTIGREEEAITTTAGRLAQTLVPIRLGPVKLVVEVVEPTEPVPADGLEHPVRLRVVRERDGNPYVGPLRVEVVAVEGRATSTFTPEQAALDAEAAGELAGVLVTPELTYRGDVSYTETLRLAVPGRDGAQSPIGDAALQLAPAVALVFSRTKKGLQWDDGEPVEWPAADRVSTVTGQVRVTAAQTQPPERELDVVVDLAAVGAVAPPATAEEPLVEAASDEQGRFELRLPGLTPVADAAPAELDFDELPRGSLIPDLAERLDVYEARLLHRVERARRPLDTLVGQAHAETLGTWRFETVRKLASESEEHFDDIVAAIELAEAGGVYTDAFATIYYDSINQARDTLASLLGDVMSLSFTLTGLGEIIATRLGPLLSDLLDALDSTLVKPGIAALRSVLRRLVAVLDELMGKLGFESVELRESAAAIRELWAGIEGANDLETVLVNGVDLIINAVLYALRAIHGLVVRMIRSLLPVTSSVMDALAPGLGPQLGPAWSKLCEDTLKKLIDEIETLPWMAGGAADRIRTLLDPYPSLATQAVGSLLADLDALRVPGDAAARRDRIGESYGSFSQEAFENRQAFATADEYLAWFNLIATLLQLAMIAYGAFKHLAAEALKKLGGQLDSIDIVAAVTSGLVHVTEMAVSLTMAYRVATTGTGTVQELTR